jgi:signal transduction histidine kinase
MLGLVLVVGIMAALLVGTLRGLWSYYVTTNSIRAKVAELKSADEFKENVLQLVAPETLEKFSTNPGHNDVANRIQDTRSKLDEYKKLVEDNYATHREPDPSDQELELVQEIHKNLDRFKEAVTHPPPEMIVPGGSRTHRAEPDGNEILALQVLGCPGLLAGSGAVSQVEREVDRLLFNTADLRNRICDQLDSHLSESRRHYQVALWIIVPSSIVGLLLMAGLLRSFYGWIFYPIRDLEAGVIRVAGGDFQHRIAVHSGDEMEDLGAAFNDMTTRLHDLYTDLARQVNERSRQLVRSERLASVGFLAAGVAHEINNPLASIAFCSEALEGRLLELLRQLPQGRFAEDREVFAKYLKMIQEEAFRCKGITERLLAFSRTGERQRDPTDLEQLIQSVLDVTQHLPNFRGKQISLEKNADRGNPGKIVAHVNSEEIKAVILNLVVNALESMDDGGKLTIRLNQRDGMAEMQFSDTGCGMTQDVLENIFEPFFTRSRTGKGTGLGLTISHRIINQHGGEIEASSPGPNRGSTFTVRLPLQPPEGTQPQGETEGPRGGKVVAGKKAAPGLAA